MSRYLTDIHTITLMKLKYLLHQLSGNIYMYIYCK